jgi:hypothetical protein
MKPRDYATLSTATLVNIQGRSAHGSAEERAVREELRRRREDWFAAGPSSPSSRPKQLQLFNCRGSRAGCAGDTPATTEKERR